MSSRWLQELQQVFGDSRVENALEGTNLVDLGRNLNFGCYVVRNAIDFGTAEAMMVQSKKDMQRIMESDVRQHRAVAVQGRRNGTFFLTQCKHVMGIVGASAFMKARQGIRFMDWSKCHHLISSTNGFIQGSVSPAPTCSMKLF